MSGLIFFTWKFLFIKYFSKTVLYNGSAVGRMSQQKENTVCWKSFAERLWVSPSRKEGGGGSEGAAPSAASTDHTSSHLLPTHISWKKQLSSVAHGVYLAGSKARDNALVHFCWMCFLFWLLFNRLFYSHKRFYNRTLA